MHAYLSQEYNQLLVVIKHIYLSAIVIEYLSTLRR